MLLLAPDYWSQFPNEDDKIKVKDIIRTVLSKGREFHRVC